MEAGSKTNTVLWSNYTPIKIFKKKKKAKAVRVGKGQTLHQSGMPGEGFELYLECKVLPTKVSEQDINRRLY